MKVDKKFIKVAYEQITETEAVVQQSLDDAFDILFDEVMRLIEKQDGQSISADTISTVVFNNFY